MEIFTSLADIRSWPFMTLFGSYKDQLQEVDQNFDLTNWEASMGEHGLYFKIWLMVFIVLGVVLYWAVGHFWKQKSWSGIVTREVWTWRLGLLVTLAFIAVLSLWHVHQIAKEHLNASLDPGLGYYLVETLNLWLCGAIPALFFYWLGSYLVSFILIGLPNGVLFKGLLQGRK